MQRKHETNHVDWYFFTCIIKNRLGAGKCFGVYVREKDILRTIYHQLKLCLKEHFISNSQYKQELSRLSNEINQFEHQYQEAFRNAIHNYKKFDRREASKKEFRSAKIKYFYIIKNYNFDDMKAARNFRELQIYKIMFLNEKKTHKNF